jgi:hypothetical protein
MYLVALRFLFILVTPLGDKWMISDAEALGYDLAEESHVHAQSGTIAFQNHTARVSNS